jgi:colicin import membrane protein
VWWYTARFTEVAGMAARRRARRRPHATARQARALGDNVALGADVKRARPVVASVRLTETEAAAVAAAGGLRAVVTAWLSGGGATAAELAAAERRGADEVEAMAAEMVGALRAEVAAWRARAERAAAAQAAAERRAASAERLAARARAEGEAAGRAAALAAAEAAAVARRDTIAAEAVRTLAAADPRAVDWPAAVETAQRHGLDGAMLARLPRPQRDRYYAAWQRSMTLRARAAVLRVLQG